MSGMAKVDHDIRQLQAVQLSLLDELDRVCKKNRITYYIAAGSCIGAVRHHGFIPWDDDIDVFMYAADVDALFAHKDDFGEGFFLQNADMDPGYNLPIARLRKRGTTLVEPDEVNVPCHHGIFLDIYILYYYPDSRFARARMVYQGIKRNILLAGRPPLNHGKFIKLCGQMILLPYRSEQKRKKTIARLNSRIRAYHDTKELVILFGMDISLRRIIRYKAEWFREPSELLFEGRKISGPTDADAYLRCRYGDDYMDLPPEGKRHSYHKFVCLDFDKELV